MTSPLIPDEHTPPWPQSAAARRVPSWRTPRAIGLLVALLGPAVVLTRTTTPELVAQAGLLWALVAAAAVLWSARRTGWALVLAAASGGWAAVVAAEATAPVVVLLLGMAAVAVSAGFVPKSGSGADPPFARLPYAVATGAQLVFIRGGTVVAVTMLVGSFALAVVDRWRPGVATATDAALVSAVRSLTRVVAVVLVFLVALPTLYLPGAILNLGSRRKRAGEQKASNWLVRSTGIEQIRRDQMWPFTTTGAALRRRRLRTGAGVTGACAVVLFALLALGTFDDGQVPRGREIEFGTFAFPDEPWVDELYDAGFGVTFHPSLGWQSTEVDTRYLKVKDGVRRSWTPEDPELTVWFLGGSAMWGLGQRDDHTIASRIAQLADAEGVRLRVENLAVPGYNQWQEIALMGFRLSRGARPDLIVMYDGANDLTSMLYRGGEGMLDLDVPPNRFHEQIESATNYPPEPRGEPADPSEVVEAFSSMYGAGVDLARRTAGAYGVPVMVYFQPQYLSTEPSAVDSPLLRAFPDLRPGPSDMEREAIARVRSRLPEGVVDLGSALDGVDSPTWFDRVHTNEIGAAIVAEQMWATLEPEVRHLERSPP